MKRLTYLFLAISILICSCSTFDEPRKEVNINLGDLYAGFDEDTRTYVKNDKYLRWNEGDCLTVFYGNTLNCQYKFNGATGDNSGSFSYVSSGDLETGNALDRIYAVYPYNETTTITDGGQISLTLPAVQTYAENSFGRGANTMLAVTRNVEGTFLAFKNACGYLKLKLYNADGATIKSIVVKGNGEEKIAGAATATIAFGEVPQLTMADDVATAITLDCGDGVALGTTAEDATEFWVVIPETTFESGITITVTDTEGGIFEKSTTKEVAIERNAIQPMEALGVEFVAPVVKPANNEIWYTASMKVNPYKTDAFGANIVSNEWNESTGEGVITFDGEVTSIGEEAFYSRDGLKSITIPDSVTTIGDQAFNSCTGLVSIAIPESITSIESSAFTSCFKLANVTIPDSVTSIGSYAFSNCSSLASVIIPDRVTSIGMGTFKECSNLASITIGNSVASIGSYAFNGCSSLASVTVPNSVTSIGEWAFCECPSLAEVIIGDSVTSIGNAAFMLCTSLASVTIGDSVTSIGDSAFCYCSSLASVIIPDSVTTIGNFAFDECSVLASATIGDSVTLIGKYAFSDCKSLVSIAIGDSVTSIGDNAFSGCSSLAEVQISDIAAWCKIKYGNNGSNPLCYAHNLYLNNELVTDLVIPDSVTSIELLAFFSCSSLLSVTIPDSVTEIFARAFEGCSNLTSVYCKSKIPPTGGYMMFDNNASDRKVYVPAVSVDAYKSANRWSDYADAIVAYDFEVVDMGLSVKWAGVNVGANSPEELGNLYAWGEVSPKEGYYSSNYAWWTYDFSEDEDGWWSDTKVTKYGSSYSNSDYVRWDGYYDSYYWVDDGRTVLDLSDDAARTEWGGSWRMPTQAECQELIDNCTIEKVKYNNCDGYLFTCNKPGYTDKMLFFPMSPRVSTGDENSFDGSWDYYQGLFWSSSQYLPFPVCAYALRVYNNKVAFGPILRQTGFPVRPVK